MGMIIILSCISFVLFILAIILLVKNNRIESEIISLIHENVILTAEIRDCKSELRAFRFPDVVKSEKEGHINPVLDKTNSNKTKSDKSTGNNDIHNQINNDLSSTITSIINSNN